MQVLYVWMTWEDMKLNCRLEWRNTNEAEGIMGWFDYNTTLPSGSSGIQGINWPLKDSCGFRKNQSKGH